MDVSLATFTVFLHVVTAFLLVAGLIGRGIVLGRARRSADLQEIDVLLPGGRSLREDRDPELGRDPGARPPRDVGAGSSVVHGWGYWLLASLVLYLSLIPLVPLIFLPRGRVFETALDDARQRGSVTPGLTAAFHDPRVAFARTYEIVVVAIVIALMLLKPF
jgi:hypothetical protein